MIFWWNISKSKRHVRCYKRNSTDSEYWKISKSIFKVAMFVNVWKRSVIIFMTRRCRFSYQFALKKISMNFIIELSFNRYENDIYNAILVVIDRYSKMTFYIFVKSTWSTEDLANVLFDKVFLIFFEKKKSDIWSKFAFCQWLLIRVVLSHSCQAQIEHCLSFTNRWTDKKTKSNIEILFSLLLQL